MLTATTTTAAEKNYILIDGKLLRPDFRVIVLREQGWNLSEEAKKYIEVMETVYFYNRNEVTHCCEVTPSYTLIHAEYRAVLTKAGEDLEAAGEIDSIRDKYEQTLVEEQVTYMHVRSVESLAAQLKASNDVFRFGTIGDPLENHNMTDAEYMEWLEYSSNSLEDEAREYVNTGSVTWGFEKALELK